VEEAVAVGEGIYVGVSGRLEGLAENGGGVRGESVLIQGLTVLPLRFSQGSEKCIKHVEIEEERKRGSEGRG
jgi:hypothetical protein